MRLAVLSFATGAVLTLAAILVPVYSSVENLSEPVALFETILADLETVSTNNAHATWTNLILLTLLHLNDSTQQVGETIMSPNDQ